MVILHTHLVDITTNQFYHHHQPTSSFIWWLGGPLSTSLSLSLTHQPWILSSIWTLNIFPLYQSNFAKVDSKNFQNKISPDTCQVQEFTIGRMHIWQRKTQRRWVWTGQSGKAWVVQLLNQTVKLKYNLMAYETIS